MLPAEDDPEAFVAALAGVIEQEDAAVVFPMTDATVMTLAGRGELAGARVACPPRAAYELLSDKGRLLERAARLGVPAPETLRVAGHAELSRALRGWSGPVVLKPTRSRFIEDGRIRSTHVVIAEDAGAAARMAPGLEWFGRVPCLLQRHIEGHGAGVFTVYGPEGPVAWFAHRRIREKPPSGGVSVLCESVAVDPIMQGHAARLLDDAGWLGPAMVEFRVDGDGRPWLMEINGRFWGSLQLAIDCGLDLPWLWHRIVSGEAPAPAGGYETGRRLRWLLGDLDSLYLTLRGRGPDAGGKVRAVLRFLNLFQRRTRLEVLRLDDPRPFLRELRLWLRAGLGRGGSGDGHG